MISRLRSQLARCSILPFVVAALTLRALVPVGWMPHSADLALTSAMCSTTPDATETFRFTGNEETGIPVGEGLASHCEFCVLSAAAAVPIVTVAPRFVVVVSEAVEVVAPRGLVGFLERAQTARGPPIAS